MSRRLQDVSSSGSNVPRPPEEEKVSERNISTISSDCPLDLHEVFNASIKFQSNSSPPPPPGNINRRSSSSSLYPSTASLSHLDNTLDVERNWESADIFSQKKHANYKKAQSSGDRASSCFQPMESSPSAMASAKLPASTAYRLHEESAQIGTRIASGTTVSESVLKSKDGRACDEDLHTQKLEAYKGGNFSATNRPDVASMSVAAVLHPQNEMLAAKLAAYEGRSVARDDHSANRHERNRSPVVACHTTTATALSHPSEDDTGTVEADIFSPISDTEIGAQHYSTISSNRTIDVVPVCNEATETTVISNGLVQVTTAEAWTATPATEATVLEHDGVRADPSNLDCKPPARNPLQEQFPSGQAASVHIEQHAEATIIDYDIHPSDISVGAVQAEFLGQDFNASLTAGTTNQAAMVAAQASEVAGPTTAGTYQVNGTEIVEEDDVMEVAVIESGPMEKATAAAWSVGATEEAQVLEQTTDVALPTFNTKPPSKPVDNWDAEGAGERDFVLANGEAEVVGITEEIHPSEYTDSSSAARAELIGSDFNTAIAVPSEARNQRDTNERGDTVEQAQIVVEGGAQSSTFQQIGPFQDHAVATQEAHATILEDECAAFGQSGSNIAPVTAVLQHDPSGRSASEPQPVTAVTILEDSTQPAVSFRDPIKPQHFSERTASSPLPSTRGTDATSTAVDAEDLEWTNVPSFGGVNDEAASPSAVMATPIATIPPPVPSPTPVSASQSRSSRVSTRGNISLNSECSVPGFQALSSNLARGANNVMETLFRPGGRRRAALSGFSLDEMSGSVLPRTLLPSSVIYSETTNSWVATVNTNQKALEANNVLESSKALRAFSVPSEKQARALASAWAPPLMHPFDSNPCCFICEAQFAVFRRASHCRNCGICVCSTCSVQWPSKMLPATYNIKKESTVNICKACDWVCSAFRLALLQGNHDKAVAIHSTGNVNLTTPFANVKGELFYPVHCAVLGGNLTLLKWLVDEHCCPLRSIRISNGKQKDSTGSYTPILTSSRRSLLGIALGNRNIGIVRYLVVEKRMLLSAEKGLSVETLAQNLDLVLRVLPEEVLGEQTLDPMERQSISGSNRATSVESTESGSTLGDSDVDIATVRDASGMDDEVTDGQTDNECIICCDNTINCVFTPCGHQICCLECGNNISRCPVCNVECSSMRVFKP